MPTRKLKHKLNLRLRLQRLLNLPVDELGYRTFKIEHFWYAVKAWSQKNGHVYDGSYGVVDVAPT